MGLQVDTVTHHARFKQARGKIGHLLDKKFVVHLFCGVAVLQLGARVARAPLSAVEVANDVSLALWSVGKGQGEGNRRTMKKNAKKCQSAEM